MDVRAGLSEEKEEQELKWRKLHRVTYGQIYKRSNISILNETNPGRYLESQICKQRLTYFRHLMSTNGLEKINSGLSGARNRQEVVVHMQSTEWYCQLTPTHIFSCPAMAAALQKIDMDPEQQLYTPKIEDIATAVIEMYGDI
ncbi:hypothetical protein LAZ67_18002688 [Cordylochernes scorpioides]|uniref:Uncharacterized protein n=1 Tax=Cordylochernes scorpioides TaxID=51811 RepID=A0ABY6LIV8_9ARAC|nr:hypothetical protein LAZ67_18002688 [Cordylochernes scorpioides]